MPGSGDFDEALDVSLLSPSKLRGLRKDALKTACRNRNLNVSGNKIDLVRDEEFSLNSLECRYLPSISTLKNNLRFRPLILLT